ncbi:unnamed protein product, partial [Notodromas monacha]
MSTLWKCILGPALYSSYKEVGPYATTVYRPNTAEVVGELIVKSVSLLVTLVKYVTIGLSPFFVSYLRRNGYFSKEGMLFLAKYSAGFAVLYCSAVFVRGFGRFLNRDYLQFRSVLDNARRSPEAKAQLAKYDFDFRGWEVDFNVTCVSPGEKTTMPKFENNRPVSWTEIPLWYLTQAIAVFVGRPLLYPGSLGLLNSAMSQALSAGRYSLISKYNAKRFKLSTWRGNHVDSIFVDARRNGKPHGDYLVVCC